MLFNFKNNAGKRGLTGVYITETSLASATVERERGQRPRLRHAGCSTLGENRDISAVLRKAHSSSLPGKQPANLVLDDTQYQLQLVEAPRVEPSELRAAVRWKIRSLIDFHIDDAVIDVFEIPGQENRPQGQSMMYVVVSHAREIRRCADLVDGSGLDLESIDIIEMALRNLASLLEDDVRGLATLYMREDHGLITLTRQGSLFFSRRLEVGTRDIAERGEDALASVALEIQRSLDYYDSHFAQPPVAGIAVLPGGDQREPLLSWLDDNIDTRVYGVELDQLVDSDQALDAAGMPDLLLAIGGALREEEVTL